MTPTPTISTNANATNTNTNTTYTNDTNNTATINNTNTCVAVCCLNSSGPEAHKIIGLERLTFITAVVEHLEWFAIEVAPPEVPLRLLFLALP